jgi:putative transposase
MVAKRIKHSEPKDNNQFVFELPLRTTPAQESEIDIRLQANQNIRNAVLGEALRRLGLIRQSKKFQVACKLPRGEDRSPERKKRTKAFHEVEEKFGFTKYSLVEFITPLRNSCWIGDHIGSHEAQAAAKEIFTRVRQYAFGKIGRPRFKSTFRARSIQGQSNATGIRWRTDHVEWGGLEIPAIFDKKDKDGYEAQALNHKTALCRVVRRTERGRKRYFVQLVQDGKPPKKAKNTIGKEDCSIDMGPSAVAILGDTKAGLFDLAPSVVQPWKFVRRLQRAMDRSRHVTNPNNYEANGTIKKGPKTWIRSMGYLRLLNKLREVERVLAATRKKEHGKLLNDIQREVGPIKHTEKISYKGWQKNFGRSSKVRAAGAFVSEGKRKAENAGTETHEYSTRTTCCSQACLCGELVKKPLSQREHICGCEWIRNHSVQRDLFSAFLGKFVERSEDSKDRLDVLKARKAWTGKGIYLKLLELAASNLNQFVSVDTLGVYHVGNGVRTDCQLNPTTNRVEHHIEIGDVVAAAEVGAR